MTIDFLGVSWDLMGLSIFIFVFIIFTEIVKKFIIKITKKNSDIINLIVSWLMGGIIFLFLNKIVKLPIMTEGLIQFFFLMAFVNGGYSLLKPIITKLKDLVGNLIQATPTKNVSDLDDDDDLNQK